MLTAMSATLNVGQRVSPKPTSMKSTTPQRERSAVDQVADRARAHERERERARRVAVRASRGTAAPRMTSAPIVSTMKIQREYGPRCRPNAAPGLYTSVSRSRLAEHLVRNARGAAARSAIAFVTTSSDDDRRRRTGQNSARVSFATSCIFLALLALDAVARVRQRVEPLEGDVVAAVVALAERLGRPVQPAQRLVDVPEEPPFLAREQERLLALHGVGALVGHVERVELRSPSRSCGVAPNVSP